MKRFLALALALLFVASPTHAWVLGGGGDRYNPAFGGTIALDSGTIFSWDSGDITLTHSADALTLAGGQLIIPVISGANFSLAFVGTTAGFYYYAANSAISMGAGSGTLAITNSQVRIKSGDTIGFSSSSTAAELAVADTFFSRDGAAANIQMGADSSTPIAQTFKGSDARAGQDTNTVGGDISFAAGRSTGTAAGGVLYLQTASPSTTSGSAANALINRWQVASLGHFLASTDNLWDIGATATNRPRNLYVASLAQVGTLQPASTAFTGLGTYSSGNNLPNMVWCGNCTVATPCAAGGPGAIAIRNGAQWACK